MTTKVCTETCNASEIHRHLSTVIIAVIQPLTRVKETCGIAATKYIIPTGSNDKSIDTIEGVKRKQIPNIVMRQQRSDTARPVGKNIYP
jgi:hypothetical protein